MTEAKRGEGVTRSARDLCWNCQSEVGGEYFCPQCVKVQPASVWSDYFDVFGLPRKLGLDLEELQRRFYDWSRKFHPDLFQRATPEEQGIRPRPPDAEAPHGRACATRGAAEGGGGAAARREPGVGRARRGEQRRVARSRRPPAEAARPHEGNPGRGRLSD